MARVILLEKIRSLGNLGQQVSVRGGYARNYLIPYGKAVPATEENVAQFEAERLKLEELAQEKLASAQSRANALSALVLTLPVKSAEEGRLYGSIGPAELVRAAKAAGFTLERGEIHLSQGPLRQLGEYDVTVQLHSDISAIIRVNLVPEQAE